MKVIIGLGNPGRKYEHTRHNIGFDVAAEVARQIGCQNVKTRFEAETTEGLHEGEKILILCPQTYMNESGRSVRKALDFFKMDVQDCLVLCDDLNLPSGRLRIRGGGSAGGQKGLADIIRHLQTDRVPRLRVGIDRPPARWTVTDYVLGKWTDAELDAITPAVTKAAQACLVWAAQGAAEAMNRYNAAPQKPKTNTPTPATHPNNPQRKAAPDTHSPPNAVSTDRGKEHLRNPADS
ncbi:MAG: aminoacyl-tRNA hydrolase [Planctomycetota bacterium]